MDKVKFDLDSIIPEGYEAADYRVPTDDDIVLTSYGTPALARNCIFDFDPEIKHIILREVFKPKPGQVVGVQNRSDTGWYFRPFLEMCGTRYKCSGIPGSWTFCRELTAEEKGEA